MLSVLASLALLVGLPIVTIARFVIWLVVGLVIYDLYSRHSLLTASETDVDALLY